MRRVGVARVTAQSAAAHSRHDLLRLLPHPARKPHDLQDRATMLTLAQAADMTGALAAYKLALAEERIAELKDRKSVV